MVTNKQSMIWGNFWQIIDLSGKLVSDYEIIITEKELVKKLPQIETAYIDSIIVHLAKILSKSKNDSSRLGQFKTICRAEIKDEIAKVEKEYEEIIGKIVTNRIKLIAHLDKKFYELCFSKNEIKKMEQNMAKRMKINLDKSKTIFASMPTTTDKSKERYSIQDFRDDLPRIKEMVKKLNDIWNRSIPLIET